MTKKEMQAKIDKLTSEPRACPVCGGRGALPGGFYGDTGMVEISCRCRTCEGSGVIFVTGDYQIVPATLGASGRSDDEDGAAQGVTGSDAD